MKPTSSVATPRAVLFDADRVLQTMSARFLGGLRGLLAANQDVDAFLADVFGAEAAPLVGDGEFRPRLTAVLAEWGVTSSVDEVLRLWTLIEPIDGLADLCRDVRSAGAGCHLATNQTRFRAAHMRTVLGYDELFDRSFYSCDVGARKASPQYFHVVLEALAVPPADVVFLDDHLPNVEVSRAIGIRGVQFDLRQHADPASALRATLRGAGLAIAS